MGSIALNCMYVRLIVSLQCMDGFQFQLPVSGHQNWILVEAAAQLKAEATLVWVHYKVDGT